MVEPSAPAARPPTPRSRRVNRPGPVNRPRRPSLLGPLAWWELTRLARRGDAARARIFFLYILLVVVLGFTVWKLYPTSPLRFLRGASSAPPVLTATDFSPSLALVLLEAQLVLVAVITPAYASAAIAEEKDRQTLALLLTTDLTDGEIVWGKVGGRVLFILLTLLAGVPVLLATVFLGGAVPAFLATGFALAATTAVLSGAIGASAACRSPTNRAALVRAYSLAVILVGGLFVPPFVLLSPFAILIYADPGSGQPEALRLICAWGYPLVQVAVASVLFSSAAKNLRKAGTSAGPISRTAYPEPPRGRPAPIVFASPEPERVALPPLNESDPVLWKERFCGRTRPLPIFDTPVRWLGGFVVLLAVILFVSGGWLLVQRALRALDPVEADRLAQRGAEPPDIGGSLMATAGVLAAGLYLLPLAIGLTGSVAGERQRGTLDPLLSTALSRRGVLGSKARAHAESGLVFAVSAVTGLGCGFAADGGLRLGLAAMAAMGAGFALVLVLGMWLSVRCAAPARAFRLALPAVVAVIGLPVLVRNTIEWDSTGPAIALFAWTAAGCAVAAVVLWWRAGRELERGL